MEVFRKAFLAGLGAFSLSRGRMKTIVDELVQQGKLKENEGVELMEEMMKKAEATRKDVEKAVHDQAHATYNKLNLATQDQLKKLEKQIRDLEAELAKGTPSVKKASASAKTAPKSKARKK